MTTPDATARTVILLDLTDTIVDDVAEALEETADRLRLVCQRGAVELAAQDGDQRTGALSIAKTLARAGRLAMFAEQLRHPAPSAQPGGAPPADPAAPTTKARRARKTTADATPPAETTPAAPAPADRAAELAEVQAELDAINQAHPEDEPGPVAAGDAPAGVLVEPPAPTPSNPDKVTPADLDQALDAIDQP